MTTIRWIAIAGIGLGLTLTQDAAADEVRVVVETPEPPPPPAPPQITIVPPQPTPQPTIVVQPAPAPQVVTVVESDREYRPNLALVASGLIISGVTYAGTVLASAIKSDVCQSGAVDTNSLGCRTETWPLYIPLAGPFIQMGYVSGTGQNTMRTLLAIDGAIQIGGLVMAVVGASVSMPPRVRHRVTALQKFHISPFASSTTAGMSAGGAF